MVRRDAFIILTQDGIKLDEIQVENEQEAKDKLSSESLKPMIVDKVKRTDYCLQWIDDPAGVPEVVEACGKMEQATAEELLQTAQDGAAGKPAEAEVKEERTDLLGVRTKGMVFQVQVDGVWKNISGGILQAHEICRFFKENGQVNETEYEVIYAPQLVEGTEDDYLIQVAPKGAADPAEPQAKDGPKTKIVDVECPETASEQDIKRLVREMQSLENARLAMMQDYNEQIKVCKKAIYEKVNGKSYKPMECAVVYDWENGVINYIRPDTGEIAKTEEIPYDERQLNMKKDLDEATPASDEAQTEQGDIELGTQENGTQPADSGTESQENGTEPATDGADDSPPPPEEETV